MKNTVVSPMAENGAPLRLVKWYFEYTFSLHVECIKLHIRDTNKCAFCFTKTVLYRYYMFRLLLFHIRGPQNQDLNLLNYNRLQQ